MVVSIKEQWIVWGLPLFPAPFHALWQRIGLSSELQVNEKDILLVTWEPPEIGDVKIKFDGCSDGSSFTSPSSRWLCSN